MRVGLHFEIHTTTEMHKEDGTICAKSAKTDTYRLFLTLAG